jgi:hypothetical protein
MCRHLKANIRHYVAQHGGSDFNCKCSQSGDKKQAIPDALIRRGNSHGVGLKECARELQSYAFSG